MSDPYDKKDQSIREIKAFGMSMINEGHLQTKADAENDPEYMQYAERHGLIKDGQLLCFYTGLPATELEHMVPKGKGGKRIKENCIPVISDFNPRRGFEDEPEVKIKRLIEERKESKRHNINLSDVLLKWQLWSGNQELQHNKYHQIEKLILKAQLEHAKLMDKLSKNISEVIGKDDPSKPRTNNYAKKLRNRKIK